MIKCKIIVRETINLDILEEFEITATDMKDARLQAHKKAEWDQDFTVEVIPLPPKKKE